MSENHAHCLNAEPLQGISTPLERARCLFYGTGRSVRPNDRTGRSKFTKKPLVQSLREVHVGGLPFSPAACPFLPPPPHKNSTFLL